MPVQPTYPGVYIEEIASGSFGITPVETSITAFLGRAVMGPTNQPTTIFSFGDFENLFGGRAAKYPLSYAVEDFFVNGGSEAVIVRIEAEQPPSADDLVADAKGLNADATAVKQAADAAVAAATAANKADAVKAQTAAAAALTPTATYLTAATAAKTAADALDATSTDAARTDASNKLATAYAAGKAAGSGKPFDSPLAKPAKLVGKAGFTSLQAANNGAWGNQLSLVVDQKGITDDVAKSRGSTKANCYNLTLTYKKPNGAVITEVYTTVTVEDTPNRVDRVLRSSNLARWVGTPPVAAPQSTALKKDGSPEPDMFTGGADGGKLSAADWIGDQGGRTGLYALEGVDLFNLLCIPWDQRGVDVPSTVNVDAAAYCVTRRAMYIVDSLASWTASARTGGFSAIQPSDLGSLSQDQQRNSMVYFPKVKKIDLEQGGMEDIFPACGIIAGQIAETDLSRGVWKAPAGLATALSGITDLEFNMSDPQQGQLNPIGINCLRKFRVLGPLIWGARTLRGADLMADDYKYVPVRRLTLFIEESLYRGTKFAVFEPNAEPLWAQLRLSVGTFMADLARQGAFYRYTVDCGPKTTTASDIDRGICNVLVAFAPVKPAEFIVLQIQQQAGPAAA